MSPVSKLRNPVASNVTNHWSNIQGRFRKLTREWINGVFSSTNKGTIKITEPWDLRRTKALKSNCGRNFESLESKKKCGYGYYNDFRCTSSKMAGLMHLKDRDIQPVRGRPILMRNKGYWAGKWNGVSGLHESTKGAQSKALKISRDVNSKSSLLQPLNKRKILQVSTVDFLSTQNNTGISNPWFKRNWKFITID